MPFREENRIRRSASRLTIDWVQPELVSEEWEFSLHPAKQSYYRQHGVDWGTLISVFASGQLIPYPRSSEINGFPVALSYHTFDDYCRYLAKAKRGYRLSYNRMEEALQRNGSLVLPAPIVLLSGGEALLFAGYRRLCLSWNYGMTPWIWLVTLP